MLALIHLREDSIETPENPNKTNTSVLTPVQDPLTIELRTTNSVNMDPISVSKKHLFELINSRGAPHVNGVMNYLELFCAENQRNTIISAVDQTIVELKSIERSFANTHTDDEGNQFIEITRFDGGTALKDSLQQVIFKTLDGQIAPLIWGKLEKVRELGGFGTYARRVSIVDHGRNAFLSVENLSEDGGVKSSFKESITSLASMSERYDHLLRAAEDGSN